MADLQPDTPVPEKDAPSTPATASRDESAKASKSTTAKAQAAKPAQKKTKKLGHAGWLRRNFGSVAEHIKQDKGFQPAAITAGILLGTTSLATPILGSMVGAGVALAGGLYLLTKTSDTALDNASAIGKKMGISPMALGVALGALTSMPELFVSASAVMTGNPAIGIGNVVGSNIANVLLILGATAAVKKINTNGSSWKFNAAVMGISTAAFAAQMAMGVLSPVMGGVMLGALGLYAIQSYRLSKREMAEGKVAAQPEDKTPEAKLPKWANAMMGIAGVAGLVGAAAFTVAGGTAFGIAAGISPAVVGVLAVAIGTSLPELTVNIKAALKGETDMAIGNILGSNVFNILLIGGLLATTGAAVPAGLVAGASALGTLNTAALGVATVGVCGALAFCKKGIGRAMGVTALGLYAAYTAGALMLGGETVEAPPPGAESSYVQPAEATIPSEAPVLTVPESQPVKATPPVQAPR